MYYPTKHKQGNDWIFWSVQINSFSIHLPGESLIAEKKKWITLILWDTFPLTKYNVSKSSKQ